MQSVDLQWWLKAETWPGVSRTLPFPMHLYSVTSVFSIFSVLWLRGIVSPRLVVRCRPVRWDAKTRVSDSWTLCSFRSENCPIRRFGVWRRAFIFAASQISC